MIERLIDSALDRAVVPGYSRFGLEARRRLGTWPADPPRMDGKVVLVTGASSGLGRAAAAGLAELGADVRVLTRDRDRSAELARVLAAETGGQVSGVTCDVSDLASVRRFTGRFAAAEERLDVLINNAGVMPPERTETADGVELTFATHVLGPHVLIERLSPLLKAAAPSRVINVSSGGMYSQKLDLDDLQSEHGELPQEPGLRAHQACPGDPHARVGAAAGARRRGRPVDAPGLGRHPGRARLAARFQQDHPLDHPRRRPGRRHHRLAGRLTRRPAAHRRLLARPPPAARALPADDAGVRSGPARLWDAVEELVGR